VPTPLRVSDVFKSFETETRPVEVLRGVSFEMHDAESMSIVGPSGSGKSTLLHLVGALDVPTAGRIEVEGREVYRLPESDLARFRNAEIGFVFQSHHLLPQYTVLENVLVPTLAFAGGNKPVERAEALLDRVGLVDRRGHRPAELSGGERQRVAVARAMIQQPSMLLCDEPTGSLDAVSAGAVADLLFDLQAESRALLIIVTHSTPLAERCGRTLELREGQCFER
jgi:lipoprotein-releasing system ATP-binding protein